jgi:hypothetical protein
MVFIKKLKTLLDFYALVALIAGILYLASGVYVSYIGDPFVGNWVSVLGLVIVGVAIAIKKG